MAIRRRPAPTRARPIAVRPRPIAGATLLTRPVPAPNRRPVLVSLGTVPNLDLGTLRGVVRAAGDFAIEALGLAVPRGAPTE